MADEFDDVRTLKLRPDLFYSLKAKYPKPSDPEIRKEIFKKAMKKPKAPAKNYLDDFDECPKCGSLIMDKGARTCFACIQEGKA